MAEAADASSESSETGSKTDEALVKLFRSAMFSLVDEKELSPEQRDTVYNEISDDDEDDVFPVEMRQQPQPEEESPYMTLKTCIKDCFRRDMGEMAKSMRISKIEEMIAENTPPPLPPARPGSRLRVAHCRQEDAEVPDDYELMSMLVMHNLDSNKLSFLKQSGVCRNRLIDILKTCRAVIQWNNVTSERLVALEAKSATRLSSEQDIQAWREQAEAAIKEFLDDILVMKVPIMPKTWGKIQATDSVSTIKNPNPEELRIRPSDDLPGVIIVGSHSLVPQVVENIMELVRAVERDLPDKDMLPVTQQKQVFTDLKPWQLRYLQIIDCPVFLETKFRGLNVQISIDSGSVTIVGPGTDIIQARIQIDETLIKIQSSTVVNVHKILLFAFTRVEFQDYIQCQLATKNLLAVIEVLSDGLWIHASDFATASTVSKIVTESVKVTYLKKDLLTVAKWKTLIESIHQRVKEPFIIDKLTEDEPAVMACAVEVQEIVMTMLAEATERSNIQERKISFERGIFLALHRCCSSSIDAIKTKYEVDVSFEHSSFLVKVVGPRSGLSHSIEELKSLSDELIVKYSSLDKPGAMEFLKSLSGNSMMKVAEDAHVCVIDIEEDTPPIGSSFDEGRRNVFKAKVTVVKGDITKQLVDVIVISVGKDPTLKKGSLTKAVSEAAGADLQKERKKRFSKGVTYGQLAVTSGGKLRCKSVFHCCLPPWGTVIKNIKDFRETVLTCLETADVSNYTSIAFPAMGCGGLGYPPHLAARALFEAISWYERTTKSGLQEINIVVYDTEEKTYKIFENERNNRLLGTDVPTKDVGEGGGTGVEITVKVGELSETTADVIVNTTNKNLRLNQGAVSMSISKEGGWTIQNECNTHYRKGINFGDIAETGGGNLRCKKVYHCCLPKWPDSADSLQLLKKTIDTCLQRAPSRGYETIAFPALGTGILQYPQETVAKVFKERVATFSQENPLTCLREVIIVLYHKDDKTTKAFSKTFDSDPTMIREPTTPDKTKSEEFRMDPLKVEVKVGTLHKEKVNTIVVPTDNKLSLKGLVGLLKSVYGPDCMVGSERANITKSGAVIVPAQNMPCTNILLVSTEYFKNNVEETIKKCFKKADKKKIMSLAIGHLIPENDADAEIFATGMERAINHYKRNLKYLSDVRVILNNAEQMSTCVFMFRQKVGRSAMRKSFLLPQEDGLPSPTKPQAYRSKSKILDDHHLPSLPRLRMLATSKEHLDDCSETVSTILHDNLETEILTDPALETLSDDKVSQVTSLCTNLHVMAQVDRSNGMVSFHGSKEDVTAAYRKTQDVVRNVNTMHQTRERAVAVQTGVQWYYAPPEGEPKAFPPVSNMLLEQAYGESLPSVTFRGQGGPVTADFLTYRFHMSPTESMKMSRVDKRAG
ncbi:protein mono-ADP-ribosyltransferase PARP14-like [Haliotis rufescens]|uniref:protein mono-ADP-ribosyltransferase PARP14-like n=1 Tax=Haliotis rufescens TaxID=6454 RepID=UPI00201F1156|nr:protein mono-ADP-ribosyltransferase PARP14-like [Haliotis rufescens]XP_048249264.1 protein mono-ADP-ribosyltransferase PARP14-like [Haliotis rufescens]XP_048249265.1 protein mono-ADP-ribosyltransferase PARP14-like [Haliotis rufescens]